MVGAIMAFGLAELVHGFYEGVPSVFTSLAQGVIELTPGEFATRAIETLGQADIPVLIASMVVGGLVVTAILANVRLRSAIAAVAAVVVLGTVALAAVFAQPSVDPVPAVATIVGALAVGAMVAEALLRYAGLAGTPAPETSDSEASDSEVSASETSGQMAGVRRRDSGPNETIQVDRRGFLTLSGAAAATGLALVGAGRFLSGGVGAQEVADRPLRIPESTNGGEDTNAGESTTEEVTHETLPEPPESASLEIEGMPELITPAANFYLIDAALTSPSVDVNNWSLRVTGEVDNPIELSYDDLLSMSTRESDVTLSCVSNEVGGGLVSNGRWTGVMLSDVLAEAGVSQDKIGPASRQLVGRSVDGWTAGFETEIALDGREALVAFGLNGNELPVKHGYPARLVVPGLYGYVSATKWLEEIELTNWDFDAYWIQRSWTKEGPIKTQSRIDTVSADDSLSAGTIPVGGVAWAPHRGISAVEVSTDGGESWNEARLADQLDDDTWRQYVYEWDASPGEYTLQVRATDGEGETQTSEERAPHGGGGTDGATGYHTMDVSVA
jgi:DMSO/TMAO reductase YedYZ molybdopterin-dependent catalytic subunit